MNRGLDAPLLCPKSPHIRTRQCQAAIVLVVITVVDDARKVGSHAELNPHQLR